MNLLQFLSLIKRSQGITKHSTLPPSSPVFKWTTLIVIVSSLTLCIICINQSLFLIQAQVLSFPRLLSNLHHQSTASRSQQQRQSPSPLSTISSSSTSNISNNNSSSSLSSSGWHFPRLSQEQAADVLLTGVQVIGTIAQAETNLNYCRTPDGQDGECSDIRKCIWLMLDGSRLRQSVCLRNLIIPAVCCPNQSNSTRSGSSMGKQQQQDNNNGNSLQLLRPKPPRKRKPSDHHQLRPINLNSNMTQNQIVAAPPPGPASLIIRNTNKGATSSYNNQIISNTTTTTSSPPSFSVSSSSSSNLLSQPANTFTITSSPMVTSSTITTATVITNDTHSVSTGLGQSDNNNMLNITKMARYPWSNSSTCGEGSRLRTGRIVGGTDSKLGQWPWMSAIYLNKNHNHEFWCGGALINNRFVLTAAHCLSDQRGNKYLADQITIKLGGVDLVKHQRPPPNKDKMPGAQFGSTPLDTNEGSILDNNNNNELSITQIISKALLGSAAKAIFQQATSSSSSSHSPNKPPITNNQHQFREYKAASVKQHPKFQRHGFYNDIGLIELADNVQFDEWVQPICLPGANDLQRDLTGYMATVLGWGTISYGGPSSKALQQVTIPIWTNKDCDDRYLQPIGKTFLCAGFLQGGKDACQGDSGGPLMISDATGRWTLHGIVSFGKTCAQAGYPGVYTRVTEYLDWIRDNIR